MVMFVDFLFMFMCNMDFLLLYIVVRFMVVNLMLFCLRSSVMV